MKTTTTIAAVLFAVLALASGPRPAHAGGVDPADCTLECKSCQHDARTIDAKKACGAITAGCCFAAGRKAPGTFIDCTCGAPVRAPGR